MPRGKKKIVEAPEVMEEVTPEIEDTPTEEVSPVAPVEPAPLPQDGYTADALRTKAVLDKEPKVRFHVPLEPGERAGKSHETVTINGYKYTIPKGVSVDIPEPVAKLLENYLGIKENVGLRYRLDQNEDKAKHL